MTPPRQRKAKTTNKRERMILTGLHAEVWVTTKEDSVACVEVIDVLARVSELYVCFMHDGFLACIVIKYYCCLCLHISRKGRLLRLAVLVGLEKGGQLLYALILYCN